VLVKRGDLNEVREGEGEPNLALDKIVGYVASKELHAGMQQRAARN
jgi:hypothetical protein